MVPYTREWVYVFTLLIQSSRLHMYPFFAQQSMQCPLFSLQRYNSIPKAPSADHGFSIHSYIIHINTSLQQVMISSFISYTENFPELDVPCNFKVFKFWYSSAQRYVIIFFKIHYYKILIIQTLRISSVNFNKIWALCPIKS